MGASTKTTGDESARGAGSRTLRSSDGVELALHHLGGAGPDLLICHATGFHGLAYLPLAGALTDAFTVWAVDFRGHGSSTPPRSGDFTWEGMADDVLACVDAIGSRVFAVGHSLGGAAILLAEVARPGSVDGAYLYEPIVFPRELVAGRAESPMSGAARNRRDVFPDKRAARDRYRNRPPLDALREDALAAYVEYGFVEAETGEVRLACRPEHEARTFEAEDKVTLDRLVGIQLDVVVGVGVPDRHPSPADLAPGIAAAIPGSRLIEYDLGHFGPLEDPDRIAADVVASLPSGRGTASSTRAAVPKEDHT